MVEEKDKMREEELYEAVSREYLIFKQQVKTKFHRLIEDWGIKVGGLIKLRLGEEERKRMKSAMELIDLEIEPEELSALAILSLISFACLTIFCVFISPLLSIVFAVLSFLSFNWIKGFPERELKRRTVKASNELVSAILYISLYMRHVPNLERAIKFASDNLTGYLAYDFKKLLWDVGSRRYEDIEEALDHYLKRWEEYSQEFVDSMYLIRSTLYQPEESLRISLLEESITRMLDGTFLRMTHYASSLRNPINAVYMLGIVLPVLGMVLFPMMINFLGALFHPLMLALLYNILLPCMVYFIVKGVLEQRPAGFPYPDVSQHPDAPKPHCFRIGNRNMPAIIPVLLFSSLFSFPFFSWLPYAGKSPNPFQVYISLCITFAIGLGLWLYFKLISSKKMRILQEVYAIERDFAHATFQLGSLLAQANPPERAIVKVADSMKGSKTSTFLNKIVGNIRRLGLSFKDALFHPIEGAIHLYPSPLIKSSMQILMETSKKSLQHAGVSLIYLARYLRNLQAIDAKVRDVLDEVLSGMRFQMSFITPVIAGIVVGLTSLITIILFALSGKVAELGAVIGGETIEGTVPGSAPFLLGIFQMTHAIPLHWFQIIVTLYVTEVVLLVAYTIANIEKPGDPVYTHHVIHQMLLPTILFYCVVAALTTFLFSSLGMLAIGATEAFAAAAA